MSGWPTFFLGVIAAAAVVMAVAQVYVIVYITRLARRVDDLSTSIERDIKPLLANVNAISASAVRAASVVVVKICRQHTAQVTLIEDDDVIETFAADRADDALDIGVLPGRSRRSDDLLDCHRLDTIAERPTI